MVGLLRKRDDKHFVNGNTSLSRREIMCFLEQKEDMFEGKTDICYEMISICILETKTSILQRETSFQRSVLSTPLNQK